MIFRFITFFACVGSVVMGLSIQAVYSKPLPTTEIPKVSWPENHQGQLSIEQLQDQARSITVKVLAGKSWGSGILIQRQDQIYTVVTNAHVLRLGDNYRIQTPDGQIYSAMSDRKVVFDGNDLALLYFRSANSYSIANLAKAANLDIGEETFAAGFPADGQGLVFTKGLVSYVLPQAFFGGYQVGYSNDIVKGMSGGPVLNSKGEVVAINGKHKYPLWGNTYLFKDGSTPVPEVRKQMDFSSWAIPIETFLEKVPQFSKAIYTHNKPQQTPPVQYIQIESGIVPKLDNNDRVNRNNSSFW